MHLECVSSGTIRKFEWIFRQFKEEIRRISSAKSRIDDAEMAQNTPKLRIKEFLRHTLVGHTFLSASMGFSLLALRAGAQPNIMPTAAEKPTPSAIASRDITNVAPIDVTTM